MDGLKRTIRNRLKKAREAAGLTQDELADLLNMNRSTYANLESGRNWPAVWRLAKLKDVLGRSVDWFLGNDADQAEKSLNNDQSRLLQAYDSIGDESFRELAIALVELLASKSPRKRKKE
ncbi:MAG TPA: helix-turn-helix domain-containing protein [Anaerolineae bacterium]|nr:helix-turn-helix domain-containing protein [Anaerolineae bacterium]